MTYACLHFYMDKVYMPNLNVAFIRENTNTFVALLISLALAFFNTLVLIQLFKCKKDDTWYRRYAKRYLGITLGLGVFFVIVGVLAFIPFLKPFTMFLGLNYGTAIAMIIIGALFLVFNAVILADVDQCKKGDKKTSKIVTIGILVCTLGMFLHTMYYAMIRLV